MLVQRPVLVLRLNEFSNVVQRSLRSTTFYCYDYFKIKVVEFQLACLERQINDREVVGSTPTLAIAVVFFGEAP